MNKTPKFFNTAGPVNQPEHYKIDPLHRWDLDEVLMLIAQRKYFILHAPRQTGKTSSLLALRDYLNVQGDYCAVYVNVESGQTARNDVTEGIASILTEFKRRFSEYIDLSEIELPQFIEEHNSKSALNEFLTIVSSKQDKPIVLLIDEIDALIGDTLISVLRQLRSGYDKRPSLFPSTVVLCGVRDIKDYRIHRSNDDIITGGSPFNIKAASLRLGNFTMDDIKKLYNLHTVETGQKFADECFDLIWAYTKGQPWLVNALAYEVTFNMKENRDRSVLITAEKMAEAKQRLVLSRQTHLDQLADKLSEDRVRRVILPMINGEDVHVAPDDEQYCIDLGLITLTENGLEISNDIYKEIIPRELTESRQRSFMSGFTPEWVNPDGSLNTEKMLKMFREFWMENNEIYASHIKGYEEAAPHLVTQAFLQRVANGKGTIIREYAVGRRRLDLMLKWKYEKGSEIITQKIVMELKIIKENQKYEKIKSEGLKQTVDYAKKCQATESHLLIFDRDMTLGWKNKAFDDSGECDGVSVRIWGF